MSFYFFHVSFTDIWVFKLFVFFSTAKIPHLLSKPKQLESDVSVGVLTDQSVELKRQQHRNGVDKLSNVFG